MEEREPREHSAKPSTSKASSLEARLSALDADWARYDALIEDWNQRSNLVGAKDARGRAEILFADAVILEDREIVAEGARVVDVGAGAGAPLLPLLLSRPDLSATLVEPRRLRVAFLRAAIESLGLSDRCVVLDQKLAKTALPGAPFDVAISRATFPPSEWLERAHGLAPRAVVMVASDPLPEGARIAERHYRLPFSGAPRALGLYVV